jgi:hypothetical protein
MGTPAEARPDANNMEKPRPAGIAFYGGFQVYSESGIDLTLLRENRKRTIEARFEANSRMVAFWEALKLSGRIHVVRTPYRTEEFPERAVPEILKKLHAYRAAYVLVGSWAMVAHGSENPTQNLEVCYSRSPRNLAAIMAAFKQLRPRLRGAPGELPFRLDLPTLQAGSNFTLSTDREDIDLLAEVPGIGLYEQVLAQSEERTVGGLAIRVLSLNGLIAAKKAAGREKDRYDLLELEDLKKARDAN